MRPPGVPDDWGPAAAPPVGADRPARGDRPAARGDRLARGDRPAGGDRPAARGDRPARVDRPDRTRAAGAADVAGDEDRPTPSPAEATDE
jgi:hypothetical protein